jgi:hypothetical protein
MVDRHPLNEVPSDAGKVHDDSGRSRRAKELAARMLVNRERQAALIHAVTAMRESRERQRRSGRRATAKVGDAMASTRAEGRTVPV